MTPTPKRHGWLIAIRWAILVVASAVAFMLSGPATVQVGRLPDGTPIHEPTTMYLVVALAVVATAMGMLIYDVVVAVVAALGRN
jgi:hypothetical protein